MNALHSLNPNNPRDRALVRGIAYASHAGSHAGEALMSWYRSSRATRQGRAHPQQQRTIRHGMLTWIATTIVAVAKHIVA